MVIRERKEKGMLRRVTQGTNFPREDGKVINEHYGVLNTQQDDFSLAHMFAPPAWHEPAQVAQFDEVVIVIQGTLAIAADGKQITVSSGDTCLVGKGTRVTYSNASAVDQCEYWSFCIPAFRTELTTL